MREDDRLLAETPETLPNTEADWVLLGRLDGVAGNSYCGGLDLRLWVVWGDINWLRWQARVSRRERGCGCGGVHRREAALLQLSCLQLSGKFLIG